MTTLEEFVFSKWKDTTADNYWKNIKRFIDKYMFDEIVEYEVVNNINYIQDYIENQFIDKSILTKKTFINAMHSLLRALREDYPELVDQEVMDYIKNQFDIINKEVVEDQSKRVVKTKSTLDNIYNTWLETSKNTPEHIFLSSVLLMPPRRCDWEHAVFVKEDDYVKPTNPFDHKYNYVIIKNDDTVKLEFYNFKTNKSCGIYSRELNNNNFKYFEKVKNNSHINPSLFGEILLEYYKLYPCKKFILTNNPNGFCKGGFTNWVIRNPMKKLGFRVNDIRKIVITEIINACGVYMDRNEKLEFAKDMGQKYLDIQEYYREVPIKETKEIKQVFEIVDKDESDEEVFEDIVEVNINKKIVETQSKLELLQRELLDYQNELEKYLEIKNKYI